MRGRVRTVANVTVKGPILKRLPRKLDVLEGENAVLLVETLEAGVEGRWSRDGEELPVICQSSSGHMHALVLPGVTREDAGEVTLAWATPVPLRCSESNVSSTVLQDPPYQQRCSRATRTRSC